MASQSDEILMEMTRSEVPEISSGAFEEITGRYLNKLLAGAYCRIRNRATCGAPMYIGTIPFIAEEEKIYDLIQGNSRLYDRGVTVK
jgi:hypothetical protein